MAPGCPHCPAVLEALTRLLKEGSLGRLEAVNVAAHPEVATAAGSRSVPWTRLGPFVLEGRQSPAELARWAAHAAAGTGAADYLTVLLQERRLDDAVASVRGAPEQLADLLSAAGNPDMAMGVRIGVAAVVEELEGSDALAAALPALEALASSEVAAIRADAAHWLGLAGRQATAALRPLLDDPDAEVREIAAESLARLAPP